MKKLFKNLNLKQRFLIIFLIFLLFSIYQIFSDTISIYFNEKEKHKVQTQNLKFTKDINLFINNLQKAKINMNVYINEDKTYKKVLHKKTKTLKIELKNLIMKYPNIDKNFKDNMLLILEQFNYIIKNIETLNNENILYKYQLLSQKFFLFISFNTHNIKIDSAKTTQILSLILNDIPYIIYNLANLEKINLTDTLTKTSFDNLIVQNIIMTNKKLGNLKIDKNLIIKLNYGANELIEFQEVDRNTKIKFYKSLTQIIDTYTIINTRLFEILTLELNKVYENKISNFYMKISIEIFAFILTAYILLYIYKSFFTYIRKIQNAHKIKSIFLSNMSHELRTPLNAIIGFLNILKESKDEKEREKFVDIIYKSSKQLLYIINDILDFSKIEDAKLKVEKKPVNIKKEFELVIDLFSANASSKNITLQTEFSEDLPTCIISDKFRIKQIVSNLISNAIKFSHEGGTIKLIAKEEKDSLYICVEDNGIGINKKSQKSIFKSFLQAKSSTSRQYGGTGLGLSISSKLVSLLGSKLKVESKEYLGSKFYFYLKIKHCKESHKKIKTVENMSSYTGNVLLVEDNPTNQFLMQITFTNLNLNVTLANDGLEAIEQYKNNKFDIIFMDDNMPNKNGVEATADIIKYEKENDLRHTPIIALTANTNQETRKKFFKVGMDEYMAKPFDIKLLHKILQKYLS